MTNKQKKEYLSQYIDLKNEMELLDDKRGRLYSIQAQKISDMPMGPQKHDKLSDSICEIITLEEECMNVEIKRLADIKMEIFEIIRALEDSKNRQVMYMRYIYGFKWEEICIKMSYDWSWVHRIHGKALKEIKIKEATKSDYAM